ncbi:hypothetical protein ZWY2020_058412 [Hordeum vulgare]|nr:hypothetical protein ZWY2020_058412 [Hordeum vulgare]
MRRKRRKRRAAAAGRGVWGWVAIAISGWNMGKSDVDGIFDPPYYEWFQFDKVLHRPPSPLPPVFPLPDLYYECRSSSLPYLPPSRQARPIPRAARQAHLAPPLARASRSRRRLTRSSRSFRAARAPVPLCLAGSRSAFLGPTPASRHSTCPSPPAPCVARVSLAPTGVSRSATLRTEPRHGRPSATASRIRPAGVPQPPDRAKHDTVGYLPAACCRAPSPPETRSIGSRKSCLTAAAWRLVPLATRPSFSPAPAQLRPVCPSCLTAQARPTSSVPAQLASSSTFGPGAPR